MIECDSKIRKLNKNHPCVKIPGGLQFLSHFIPGLHLQFNCYNIISRMWWFWSLSIIKLMILIVIQHEYDDHKCCLSSLWWLWVVFTMNVVILSVVYHEYDEFEWHSSWIWWLWVLSLSDHEYQMYLRKIFLDGLLWLAKPVKKLVWNVSKGCNSSQDK